MLGYGQKAGKTADYHRTNDMGNGFIEGIRFNPGRDPEKEKDSRKSAGLDRAFPTRDRSVFSDHFNLSEFSKRENRLDRQVASLIRKSILETVREENLNIFRSGKHSSYFTLESPHLDGVVGNGAAKIGIRRLRRRSEFENDEAYAAAVEGFENGIRIQNLAFSKGVRVPELYFLIHEKDENGEHDLYCGMEHIDGLTLGQICNPDGLIADLDMQEEEVEENVRKSLEKHPEVSSWPFEDLIPRVERELSLCHDASTGKPPFVHRDCHEDNVIFSLPEGKPVIIDFDDGRIGQVSDSGFATRLETYRGESGDLHMTDIPIVSDDGRTASNAVDNLKKYLDAVARVVKDADQNQS